MELTMEGLKQGMGAFGFFQLERENRLGWQDRFSSLARRAGKLEAFGQSCRDPVLRLRTHGSCMKCGDLRIKDDRRC